MKINRQEFIDVLTQLKPGLARQDGIVETSYFIFDKRTISSFNDEITITKTFKTEIEGCIDGSSLLKLLDRLKDDTVYTKVEENLLIIQNGNTEAKLTFIEDNKEHLTIFNLTKEIKWKDLPTNFIEALKFCIFSASVISTKHYLTCLNISKDTIVSCDDYRATEYKLSEKIKDDFLLTRKTAEYLINYIPIKYNAQTKGWIHFSNEDHSIFSARLVETEYPDTSFLFDIEGSTIKLPDEFFDAIDRTEVLITADFDHDKYVIVKLDKDKIICEGTGMYGTVKETLPQKHKGKKFGFIAHPTHLKDILKRTRRVKVGTDQLLFRDKNNFKHVISLISE